jgi:uncharacterized ferritin-like protein (DUF455 family)
MALSLFHAIAHVEFVAIYLAGICSSFRGMRINSIRIGCELLMKKRSTLN